MNRYLAGIFGKNIAGWELLLRQEGVPYSAGSEGLTGTSFSAVIVADDADPGRDPEIMSYLEEGGSLICSAEIFSRLTGSETKSEYVKYLMPEPDSPFGGIWMVDVKKKCTILKESNCVRTQNGTRAVFLGNHSGGHVAVLPFDCGRLVGDMRTSSKSFFAGGSRFPHERVSTVSKGNLRRLFTRCLELLHHKRGLPYAHLWHYSHDELPPFVFRIDTDYASTNEVDKLYLILRNNGIKATWFLDVKSQRGNIHIYKQMKDQEISLHCYEHKPYNDYARVNENILRGLNHMRVNDLVPPGYASPYGMWNYEIARAINSGGFEYSSEFSYDYDNLPSYPWLGSEFSDLPQIPVHPVSIGSLRRQGYNGNSMKEYYRVVIDRHLAERIPVILYYHPKDGNEDVLKFVFSYLREKKLESTTMADFARWWKERAQIRFVATIENFNLKINWIGQSAGNRLRITRKDGYEAFAPADNNIDLNKLVWRQAPVIASPPANISRIRKFNQWIVINKFEDAVRRIIR